MGFLLSRETEVQLKLRAIYICVNFEGKNLWTRETLKKCVSICTGNTTSHFSKSDRTFLGEKFTGDRALSYQ